MPDQEERLLLETVFEDKATDQLVRLRAEMQRLTGPEMQGGIEKLQKQTDVLQRKMVPLYSSFSKTAELSLTFVRGLGPMGAAIGSIGTAALAAGANVARLTNKLQDLGRLAMETALPAATIKNILDDLMRGGVPPEVREQMIRSLSKNMADIQRDSSELTVELRSIGRQSGAAGRENMDIHIALLRKLAGENKPAEFLNEVKRAIQEVHKSTEVSPQRAAELAKILQGLYGVDQNILRNIKDSKDATNEQNKAMDESVAKALELERAINDVKGEVIKLLDEIAKMFGGVETATEIVKGIANILEGVVKFLDAFGKPMAPAGERLTPEENRGETFEGLPGLEGGVIQKQSYSGEEGGFAGMLHKAAFEENTGRLIDGTRARHDLTEELRILNDFFRARLGGGLGSGSSGGGPGSTTITTPDGAQVVTRPGDQIRVADALIQSPNSTILATQNQTPRWPGGSLQAGLQEMMALQGKHEKVNEKELLDYINKPGKEAANVSGDKNAWCARLVNASLKRHGVRGTYGENRALASSFIDWGSSVDDPTTTQRGDVVVVTKGKKVGEGGAHVTRATGNVQGDWIETISGNLDDKVGIHWYNAKNKKDQIVVRRGEVPPGPEATERFPLKPWPGGEAGEGVEHVAAGTKMRAQSAGRYVHPGEAEAGKYFGLEKQKEAETLEGQQSTEASAPKIPDPKRTNLDGLDRAMGNEMNHKVEGSGKINVEVGGAKNGGNGKGESLLKRTEMPRQRQMEPAKEAPSRFL